MSLNKYIKDSLNENINKRFKEFYLFNKVPIQLVSGELNKNLDIKQVSILVRNIMKSYNFIQSLEGIYIGEFPELLNRNIQAMYKDGIIYLSTFRDQINITNERVAKDIIHEIGHLNEDIYNLDIYGDGYIYNEFVGKKTRLYDLLRDEIQITKKYFIDNSEYNSLIDKTLYKDIGYNKLNQIIIGLFLSPYSITSISEYFGNGWEEYFTGDRSYLRQICPILYSKIQSLETIISEG